MRRIVVSAFSGIALLTVSALSLIALPGALQAQSTVTVESGNLYFCGPSFQNEVCDTTITAGDTVLWDNVEGLHTVTQCNEDFSVCPPEGGFDSDVIGPGDTFSVTFSDPGTFYYWCALHPIEMRGRVIVQEATPAPTEEPTAEPAPTPEGQTAAPTADPTPTPGGIPPTGGPPTDTPLWLVLALLGGFAAAIAGAGILVHKAGRD